MKIDSGGKEIKKFIALLLCGILTATALTGCGSSSAGGENGEVIVYNWGEYIDPDTITMFEKETGIKVVYDEFETNEIMYPKVEAGSSAYDVVCPSDYMVQKMIENDLIQELDYDIKCKLKIAHHVRYMDNYTLADDNKKKLHQALLYIRQVLGKMRLRMKSDWQVFRFEYTKKNGKKTGRCVSAWAGCFTGQKC